MNFFCLDERAGRQSGRQRRTRKDSLWTRLGGALLRQPPRLGGAEARARRRRGRGRRARGKSTSATSSPTAARRPSQTRCRRGDWRQRRCCCRPGRGEGRAGGSCARARALVGSTHSVVVVLVAVGRGATSTAAAKARRRCLPPPPQRRSPKPQARVEPAHSVSSRAQAAAADCRGPVARARQHSTAQHSTARRGQSRRRGRDAGCRRRRRCGAVRACVGAWPNAPPLMRPKWRELRGLEKSLFSARGEWRSSAAGFLMRCRRGGDHVQARLVSSSLSMASASCRRLLRAGRTKIAAATRRPCRRPSR